MRIRLKKGEQKKLILLVKNNNTWKELALLLKLNESYLSHDIKDEKVLISSEVYNKICKLTNKKFDEFIIEKLTNNWGKTKGGNNSYGSTIKLIKPKFDEKLAEFIGAVLGDGHVFYHKKEKVGVYGIRIAGDLRLDKNYHQN
ncbi:MAG: hypothetical protein WC915_06695 [archaeon]|jgi:hypothetical protein